MTWRDDLWTIRTLAVRAKDPAAIAAVGRLSKALAEAEAADALPTNERVAMSLLATLDPRACDDLRRFLIRDLADRDEIAMQLLRYRDSVGDELADFIEMLTTNPEERRMVARLLAEIEAHSGSARD